MKSAFLNGDLNKEVYVAQPQGLVIDGAENKAYRLRKTLYRLKQAPRVWYSKTDSVIENVDSKEAKTSPLSTSSNKGIRCCKAKMGFLFV